MIQRNGKIPHSLELDEIILLKWPYCPRQSIDLMRSLSKHPWHFHRTRINNPINYMVTQKAPNCQSNPEEKEQSWKHNPSRIRNQHNTAQKQTYRQKEQNREPRNNLTLLRSINLQLGCKNIQYRDFSGGAVDKTPCSQCREPRFVPWSGN